ncbi:hypothetical protein [Rhodobacter lacus]|uniref:Uncharacterized protein n=1 Tax=Rhodobacter lacus TaxID=1641972 RepID=A0ABW5A763_9RHOB
MEAVTATAAQLSRIAAAFVWADLARARQAGIVASLRERGGRLVLLGELAENSAGVSGLSGSAEGLEWVILLRPFFTSDVQELLGPRDSLAGAHPAAT